MCARAAAPRETVIRLRVGCMERRRTVLPDLGKPVDYEKQAHQNRLHRPHKADKYSMNQNVTTESG